MEKPYDPADHQFEWLATVKRADGTLMERRFWLWPTATEADAKQRAFDIWTEARVGNDQSMLNPKLKVQPTGYRPRANTRKGNMLEIMRACHELTAFWRVTRRDWKADQAEGAPERTRARINALRAALDKLERSLPR